MNFYQQHLGLISMYLMENILRVFNGKILYTLLLLFNVRGTYRMQFINQQGDTSELDSTANWRQKHL